MPYSEEYFRGILSGFVSDSLSRDQVEELFEFIQQDPALYDRLMNESEMMQLIGENAGIVRKDLPANADERIRTELLEYAGTTKVVQMPKRWGVWRVAAAAVLVAGVV